MGIRIAAVVVRGREAEMLARSHTLLLDRPWCNSLSIYIQKHCAHQLLMGVTHTAVGYSSSENVGERKRFPNQKNRGCC